jgi:amidase
MPTTPMTAFEHKADVDRVELVNRAQGKKGRTRNTMPFDMSGHPAISVPCGMADGLPIGLMLVGRQFEEATVLRAASAFERDADWQSLAF